jgi:hypothetical protein
MGRWRTHGLAATTAAMKNGIAKPMPPTSKPPPLAMMTACRGQQLMPSALASY